MNHHILTEVFLTISKDDIHTQFPYFYEFPAVRKMLIHLIVSMRNNPAYYVED